MEGNDDLNLKAINASVGRLVWVRLRNASWWPGQILLHDQVPENSLVTPNVGTPIKLLARDDVNVEWYILEKSKSVKAFRCGEYDNHIEKAKAAAVARATKKRTAKFTRREIAINTALEIEKNALLDHNLCSSSREADEDGLDSAPELLQETNNNNVGALMKVQPKRRRTPNDSEDDGTEGIKRMRGLEDIGKEHVGGAMVVYRQEVGGDSVSNGDDKACSPLSLKRKRSQVTTANESSKRKNRRRQLTKVLESTAMVSVPVTSGTEPVESMKSVSVVINNSSDSTGVSCENASENVVVGGASHCYKAKDSDISSLSVSAEDDSSDQLFDVPLTGKDKHSPGLLAACTITSSKKALDVAVSGSVCTDPPETQLVIYDLNRIEKSTSEWQLKGKRISRQMSKKQEARRFVYGGEVANNNTRPPALFEVKIEVKASSNKPRVPLVSRMSGLNGKAIVGHPVSVEALEEDYFNGMDRMVMSQAVVKAKSLSKKKSKKKKSWNSKKKSSSSASIKTRRLSTLTSQKLTMQTAGKAKETVVACIPLKVVFSRINQLLKGSARQTPHRALPSAGKP